jgi:hypothetical protein
MNEKIGKYMTAIGPEQVPGKITLRWRIVDRHDGPLGVVAWYTNWRQYCFEPSEWTVFSAGCFLDLADFIRRVNKEHKPTYVPSKSWSPVPEAAAT